MNNITITNSTNSIIPRVDPGPAGCFAATASAPECNTDNIKESLTSLPAWGAISTVFKVIAIVFLVKQIFTIVKAIIAAEPIKAVKAAAWGALGTFFLFDLANTIGIIIGFKDVISGLLDYVINIFKKQ
jgi:hypothetical protein